MKPILLYSDGRYEKVKLKKLEETLYPILKRNSKELSLILIPYYEKQSKIYIPVRPSKDLIFDHAKIQFFTSLYNLDYDTGSFEILPCDHPPIECNSLIEFINALFYFYKVDGFNDAVYSFDYGSIYVSNVISIEGIFIETYTKENDVLFQYEGEHSKMELDFPQSSMPEFSTSEDDGIENFIPLMRYLVKKADLGSSIALDNSTWFIKRKIRGDYKFLSSLNRYNCYRVTTEEEQERFMKAPAITLKYLNLITDSYYMRETEWIKNWKSAKTYREIRSRIETGDEIDYLFTYETEIVYANDFMELLSFANVMIEYQRYILFSGVYGGEGEPDNYRVIMVLENSYSNEKLIMLDYMTDDLYNVQTGIRHISLEGMN